MAKTVVANQPKQAARKQERLLDLDAVAAKLGEQPDFLPYLRLTKGREIIRPSAIVTFMEATPRMIEFTNDDDEADEFPAIEVRDEEDGAHYTLPCSAGSLQRGLVKLKKDNGTLEGVRARVSAEIYDHKQYGRTVGYRVTQLRDGEAKTTSGSKNAKRE